LINISPTEIHDRLDRFISGGKKVFVSSSFQSHSIPLLHVLATSDHNVPVYFLDTGYHFPETLEFRDTISKHLDLDLRIIKSTISPHNQIDNTGKFFFCSNTEYCCHINKVLPLEPVLKEFDVWITGVRADQNNNRKTMNELMNGPFGIQRYHPMLQWSSKDIWAYRKRYELVPHPLEAKGYLSIGCAPCTSSVFDQERAGRWQGKSKDECGLHIDLVKK